MKTEALCQGTHHDRLQLQVAERASLGNVLIHPAAPPPSLSTRLGHSHDVIRVSGSLLSAEACRRTPEKGNNARRDTAHHCGWRARACRWCSYLTGGGFTPASAVVSTTWSGCGLPSLR